MLRPGAHSSELAVALRWSPTLQHTSLCSGGAPRRSRVLCVRDDAAVSALPSNRCHPIVAALGVWVVQIVMSVWNPAGPCILRVWSRNTAAHLAHFLHVNLQGADVWCCGVVWECILTRTWPRLCSHRQWVSKRQLTRPIQVRWAPCHSLQPPAIPQARGQAFLDFDMLRTLITCGAAMALCAHTGRKVSKDQWRHDVDSQGQHATSRVN